LHETYQKVPATFGSGLLSRDVGDSAQKHCRVIRLGKVEENKQAWRLRRTI
jgi:hypothetical protein